MRNKKNSIIGLLIVMVVLFGFTGCKSSDEAKNIDLTTLSVTAATAEAGILGSGHKYVVNLRVEATSLGDGVTVSHVNLSLYKDGQSMGGVKFSGAEALSSARVMAATSKTSRQLTISDPNNSTLCDQLKIEVVYTDSKNEQRVAEKTIDIQGLYEVEYRVTGVKRAYSIIYDNEQGDRVELKAVNLPFSIKRRAGTGDIVYLYAMSDMDDGTIKVEILVNGTLWLSKEDSGWAASASVSGKF